MLLLLSKASFTYMKQHLATVLLVLGRFLQSEEVKAFAESKEYNIYIKKTQCIIYI